MVKGGRRRGGQKEFLPPWAVDPKVREFLACEGIELSVYADSAFLKGAKKKPLIILRKPRQNQPIFYPPQNTD